MSESFAGERAVVLGGVEAKGLDVSQQRDPLVQPRLGRANVEYAPYQGIGEQGRRLRQLV